MSLHKGLLFAMLFAIVALAEPGRVNVYKAEFDVPKPNTLLRAAAPATAALLWYGNWQTNKPSRWLKAFHRKGELPPATFLPIQFKNPKDLGIGKLLVASRGLGDPHFARTVILLVQYDENGVVGLFLSRRTDVPLSQVLDLKAAKDRSDPVYIGGPMEPSAAFALFQSSANIEKAENIFSGVYLISDKGLFEKTIADRPDPNVFSRLPGICRMDARSTADRGAIGRVVRFSGRHYHNIQFRSGFFMVADDSEDRVAIGED